MQASGPPLFSYITRQHRHKARRAPAETKRARNRLTGINPWVAICILAISGWAADSMLVSIELHRLDGGDLRAHLTHFWYGPLVLLALLLIVRKVLPSAALWVPRLTARSVARWGQRGRVRRLAGHLTAHSVESDVLVMFMRNPNMTISADDVAGYVAHTTAETTQALAGLLSLGLVEGLDLADTRFYRLTRCRERCAELEDLQDWYDWHRSWQEEAGHAFALTIGDREGREV